MSDTHDLACHTTASESGRHVRTKQTTTLPSDQDSSGRTLGEEEIAAVTAVLRSGTLVSTKGDQVKNLERMFAGMLDGIGALHATASSSGTSAIHAAIAALDPEPGDEIVTTPITDMGALSPILYQGAIPRFADVDPRSCNVTSATVEAACTDRTRAIVVTHLFGNPADMDAIMAVADRRGIPVIEDCAQAYLARSRGRLVGTIGRLGCFSLQQGKHITTGEGGLTLTYDEALARRVYLWVNKGYGYGSEKPDHEFLAPNARMTELQGAVAGAQLHKLEAGVVQRQKMAAMLTSALSDIEGVLTPEAASEDEHVYWKYCLTIDPAIVPGGPVAVGAALREQGVASSPRYIQKPAFECTVFTEQRTFGSSRWPFTLAQPDALDYSPARFPGTYAALDRVLVLPWNERYEEVHVEFLAEAIQAAIDEARTGSTRDTRNNRNTKIAEVSA